MSHKHPLVNAVKEDPNSGGKKCSKHHTSPDTSSTSGTTTTGLSSITDGGIDGAVNKGTRTTILAQLKRGVKSDEAHTINTETREPSGQTSVA